MGNLVSSIREAVGWSGPAVVIIFTLGRVEECLQSGTFEISGVCPEEFDIYRMHPESDVNRMIVWEYDLTFRDISQEFVSYLMQCLRKACAGADGVAWLGFEGS